MNLDELQSVQARERQSSDLQHLRSSFYREVGEFIKELTEERARIVEQTDDPFSSSEVRQLSDDIETAEQTVEAIYERRVGKVVKKASIAAAGMPVDDDGLTNEEQALFDDLVARIEDNRETVLSVLDGEGPSVSCSIDEGTDAVAEDTPSAETAPSTASGGPTETPEAGASSSAAETEGVSAADLMGSGPEEATANTETDAPAGSETAGAATPESPSEDPLAADSAPTEVPPESEPTGVSRSDAGVESDSDGSTDDERPPATGSERDVFGIPRTTVRITADVGEVVGADDRDYDLGSEDVVKLPEPNAEVLVKNGAAERLE